ncbi:MAG: hypothetical protein U0359_14625 [Byssovorax sp.]
MTTKHKADKPAAPASGRPHSKAFLREAKKHAGRSDDGNAFLPDPGSGRAVAKDDLAEEIAEDFLTSATSGEEAGEDIRDAVVPEDFGGPFVPTSAKTEFADGTDLSNPEDAEPAAFPTATGIPTDED